MNFLPIVLIILAVVALIVVALFFNKRKGNINDEDISDAASFGILGNAHSGDIIIPITQLPATTAINEICLFEIKDQSVIARISATIPNAAQAAAKTATNKALKSVELFKLDIPSTALTKSKEAKNAFRAFSRNKKGITKQANLVKVDPSQMTKATAVTDAVANVMNVGSLIVGQYYMTEINNKLESIGKTLDKVSEFQDRQFKSEIMSLLARVSEVSQFSAEILENNEIRTLKLNVLEDLKGIATKLIGQVNIEIEDIAKKGSILSYQDYQKAVDNLGLLIQYQTALLSALDEISKLTYLLGKSGISSDMSFSMYNRYYEQSIKARYMLGKWHDKQVAALKIELDKNRKMKSGVEGLFAAIPALIDDKWKYKALKDGLANKINSQDSTNLKTASEPKAIYEDDVQIIIKDGKYFYLHEEQGDE